MWVGASLRGCDRRVGMCGKVPAREQPGDILNMCSCKPSKAKSPKLLNQPTHNHSAPATMHVNDRATMLEAGSHHYAWYPPRLHLDCTKRTPLGQRWLGHDCFRFSDPGISVLSVYDELLNASSRFWGGQKFPDAAIFHVWAVSRTVLKHLPYASRPFIALSTY